MPCDLDERDRLTVAGLEPNSRARRDVEAAKERELAIEAQGFVRL